MTYVAIAAIIWLSMSSLLGWWNSAMHDPTSPHYGDSCESFFMAVLGTVCAPPIFMWDVGRHCCRALAGHRK